MDLVELGTIEVAEAPLHLAHFDPTEELLWTASQAGMVYAHHMPSGDPHVAFPNDTTGAPCVGLFPYPFGLMTLGFDCVRFISKGGCLQASPGRSPEVAPSA
jgi:hypothetical protein